MHVHHRFIQKGGSRAGLELQGAPKEPGPLSSEADPLRFRENGTEGGLVWIQLLAFFITSANCNRTVFLISGRNQIYLYLYFCIYMGTGGKEREREAKGREKDGTPGFSNITTLLCPALHRGWLSSTMPRPSYSHVLDEIV